MKVSVRWVRQWWIRRKLIRDLHNDIKLHKNLWFRQAFPIKHTKDFYCSDPCCTVKHKIW
jgi:hypothetical protein